MLNNSVDMWTLDKFVVFMKIIVMKISYLSKYCSVTVSLAAGNSRVNIFLMNNYEYYLFASKL